MGASGEYTLVRDSVGLERMWYLFGRLGIQSNINVAVQYANNDDMRLSKHMVLDALRTVVADHPQLRLAAIPVPAKKKGNTGLSIGFLHEIDLEQCVEFLEDGSNSGITAQVLERIQNRWDFMVHKDRPLWKVFIVGTNTVVFSYSHVVGDGSSGYMFQRAFLAALNAYNPPRDPEAQANAALSTWIVRVDASKTTLPPSMVEVGQKAVELGKPWKPSFFAAIWPVVVLAVLQLFFAKWFMFADLPEAKPYLKSVTAIADDSDRVKSKVAMARIPASTMDKVLTACRANGTTFTAFLHTVLSATLAHDAYPDAFFSSSNVAYDMRLRLPEPLRTSQVDNMGNSAGSVGRVERANKYRALFREDEKMGDVLDVQLVWEHARETKQWIHQGIDKATRGLLCQDPCGPDLDYFVDSVLSKVSTVLRPGFLISNPGVFTPREHQLDKRGAGTWRAIELAFSASPVHGRVGHRAPAYGVSGVKGGPAVITTAWQDGVANLELAQSVLDATVERIESLVA